MPHFMLASLLKEGTSVVIGASSLFEDSIFSSKYIGESLESGCLDGQNKSYTIVIIGSQGSLRWGS